MHELYELKDKLMKELEEYGKQELTAGSLEVVDKLSHSIKNLCKIIEAYEMKEEGQSMRGGGGRYSREGGRGGNRYAYEGGQGGGRGGNRYAYEGGGSYARGRTGNVRRDSMGRYAREGNYSRTDGVEELVNEIQSMMQDLPQNLQMDAQKFIQKLEQEL